MAVYFKIYFLVYFFLLIDDIICQVICGDIMNTLYDMKNLLLHLYIESCYEYLEDDDYEDEEDLKTKRYNYIIEKIYSFDVEYKENFLSLLSLYYYLLEKPKSKILDEKDEILDLIDEEEKDVILDGLNPEQTTYIYEILNYIIIAELSSYIETSFDYYSENDIDDYDEYKVFNNFDDNKTIEIVKKLHPNLDAEDIRYNKYANDEKLLKEISGVKIKSLTIFIQLFMMLKSTFTYKKYLGFYTANVLSNLNTYNYKLHDLVALYILKYCYVVNYIHNPNFEDIKEFLIENSKKLYNLDKYIIDEFTTFDLTRYIVKEYGTLSEEEKESIDKIISINKIETYGTTGCWCEYKEEDKDIITGALGNIDFNNNTKKIIYYSIDKDGNYTIPRICLEIIDNNIVNIIGKEFNGNMEFDLLNILSKKIEEYDNYNYLQSELVLLENLSSIETKINGKQELTLDEIDLLYEINFNLEEVLFSNYQYKASLLKLNTNMKKDLARYFKCSIDEVAEEQGEITDKTVVTTYFFPSESKCYYPNLKIIFCDAWGDFLESAEGLPSLEYIKGDAMFANLKSSYGLSKLVRIDGNAIFNSLEDDSYFNPNLIIKGNPGEYDNGFVLKK